MSLAKHWSALLDDYVIDLAWSPGGSTLAAASQSGGVMIYDAKTGAVCHTLQGHADGTNVLSWSPTGLFLATGGQDGFIRLWNPSTGEALVELKLGDAWVEHLVWQPPGNSEFPLCLIAAAGKKLAAIQTNGAIAHQFPDAPKTITALAWRPDGGAIATACFGHVVIWDTVTFTAQKEFPYGNTIHALTWSPDGKWLVAGCQDNAVHLWVPAAADLELHMSGYETKLKELSFSHDSKWLATGGGRDACVWDCTGKGPEGREPLSLPHSARVCAVAFQNRHSRLATGSADGVFTLWDPNRKNPMIAEARMPAAVTKFAWSPDDTLLAVGTEKGALFVFKTG